MAFIRLGPIGDQPFSQYCENKGLGVFLIKDGQVDSGNPVTTSYTVFRSTKYGPGEVWTGWTYSDGEAQIPEAQYCYFTMYIDRSQRGLRIDIGKDGRQLAPMRRVPNVNFNDAYRLCTWFNAT
jgi:hypothetical protein